MFSNLEVNIAFMGKGTVEVLKNRYVLRRFEVYKTTNSPSSPAKLSERKKKKKSASRENCGKERLFVV